jgi:hypothetical protein
MSNITLSQPVPVQAAFERSDLYTDPDSSYWSSLFVPLARKLAQAMGREAYNDWFDAAFPEDDDIAYTWREKYLAVELQMKAQVQP